ncbi:right-handed parallel beta-helix repeat-containing protein, partial [Candidatus Pacearchaeota archaeon]|nr:right-handed parallel beta-helix repeat-containing protein [Candidatus Pacearchaeota archaeon]
YVSNLQKFNSTQYYLYINQSKNATAGFDNGTYTYFASAKDAVGNANQTEIRTLTIGSSDTTAPNISAVVAINSSGTSGGRVKIGDNVTINATITDNVNITNVWLKIWLGGIETSAVVLRAVMNWISGNLWSVVISTNSTWNIGEINYTVYANDSTGNTSSMNGTFEIYNPNSCQVLNVSGTYLLTDDIANNTLTSACMNITAANVTLDCGGNYISSTQNVSGVYSNQLNTTVKNCNITVGGNSGVNENAVGIYFNGANNGTIFNNSANVSVGRGIWLYLSSNNNLTSNTGTSNSSNGIYLWVSSDNNILTNNTGTSKLGVGIYLAGLNNNTLVNNTGTSKSSYGIFIYLSSNNNMTGNTGTSNSSAGIVLQLSSNNTLISNTGTSNSSVGIWLTTNASYNSLTGNTGTSNSSVGIYLYSSSNNNTLTNNIGTSNSNIGIAIYSSSNNTLISNTGTSNSSYAVYLSVSHNNTIINQNATGYSAGSYGFYIDSSNNTQIRDCINVSGVANDTLLTSSSKNTTFTNCSYNLSKESVSSNSQLFRKWYYRAYVNDSAGNVVNNANVSAYNITGISPFNLTTNSSGFTNRTEITEYVNNGTRTYSSNYTINATNGTLTANHSYNVSASLNNLNDVFTLSDTTYPSFSDYYDNNGSVSGTGRGLFNVTVANTNGSVWLEINNTNVSAENLSANVYNASYNFLLNGTYSYKWHSWGNGASNNYNVSNTRNYTVNNSLSSGMTYPSFVNLTNNYVCEGSSLSYLFNISDLDGDVPSGSINLSLFDLEYIENLSSTLKSYRLFSGVLTKADAEFFFN